MKWHQGIVLSSFLCVLGLLWLLPNFSLETSAESSYNPAVIYSARIDRLEQKPCVSDNTETCTIATVTVFEKNVANVVIEIGVISNLKTYNQYNVGDIIEVRYFDEGNNPRYAFEGPDRNFAFVILIVGFVLVVLGVGGWKGVRSIVALSVTTLIVFGAVLPQILQHPEWTLWIGTLGVAIIYATNQVIGHGFNKKSLISIICSIICFGLVLGLSIILAGLFRISGFGDDGAIFIRDLLPAKLNLGDLFIVGILMGLAGALDDVNSTQTTSIEELATSLPYITFAELFRKGMRIGTEHMVSMINTLFLAYISAALPTMLLFAVLEESAITLISREDITEEIVRTLVATSGLVLAIPLTTLVTTLACIKIKPRWYSRLLPSSQSSTTK